MSSPATPADPASIMRSLIQRIATGPELSKDLSLEEARTGMSLILDGGVEPVQAGVFLIALRMKRETDAENRGVLEAIRAASQTITAPVDEVVDIAEPYDGCNRMLPASPFLPAVLAALGLPAVCHGLEAVGPKFGVTHRQILRAAGVPVDLSLAEVANRLGDPGTGWAYVDQKVFAPPLHALVGLRTLIVKRPVLTTVENLLGPVRGRRQTHLITGYVHKTYPRLYALLARHAGFVSALIVRGVEGGVIPSLRQSGKVFFYHERDELEELEVQPVDLGIDQPVRAVPLPEALVGPEGTALDTQAVAQTAAEAGLAALAGKPGPTRDSLIYGAALCLWHLRRYNSLAAAAAAAREVLDSGKALARFNSCAAVENEQEIVGCASRTIFKVGTSPCVRGR
jgi:anthranilate phosphoribosyltransferase